MKNIFDYLNEALYAAENGLIWTLSTEEVDHIILLIQEGRKKEILKTNYQPQLSKEID